MEREIHSCKMFRFTTEERIAENRCDSCEEVMSNDGHDYGGPVVCDACHAANKRRRLPSVELLDLEEDDEIFPASPT